MNSEMRIGYSQQEGIKNISKRFLHLCAIVSFSFRLEKHEWIFGFRCNAPPGHWWETHPSAPDLTQFTTWRMWCERKVFGIKVAVTGKESDFTFGICSLLIAFYCILMCADENPSAVMMMMVYKGICVSVTWTKLHYVWCIWILFDAIFRNELFDI